MLKGFKQCILLGVFPKNLRNALLKQKQKLLVVRGSRDVKETANDERSGLHQASHARTAVRGGDDHLLLFTPRTVLVALLLIYPQLLEQWCPKRHL